MDKRLYLKQILAPFFSTINKQEKKYTKIWLSKIVVFGMAINSYHLNVKLAEHPQNRTAEIMKTIKLLEDNTPEAWRNIMAVVVVSPQEDSHCGTDDVLVLRADPVYQ